MPNGETRSNGGVPVKTSREQRFAELSGVPLSLWRYWEVPAALICMLMAWAAMHAGLPAGLSDRWHLLGTLGIFVSLVWFLAALFRRRDEPPPH